MSCRCSSWSTRNSVRMWLHGFVFMTGRIHSGGSPANRTGKSFTYRREDKLLAFQVWSLIKSTGMI
ncbi:unnamed protein product [Musa acuminata subsp. malaccensis]|uniref:(wild Malaysian banana) hypothetical protein n=1 Tax=Musa acuminata subsp. malaccensis TaxID=214687 RepID=A0A804KXW0_MUSAM|nr:unnamed protein product [Musa acuminata subsp. malaccensis]